MLKTVLLVTLLAFCTFAETDTVKDRADAFVKAKEMIPSESTLSNYYEKNGLYTLKYETG